MRDDVPDAASISESDGEYSDDDLSVNVESRNTTECCEASEGATSKDKPPPRCSERVQKRVQEQAQQDQEQARKEKPKTPPRRSRRIAGEDAGPEFVKLASHPD